MKAHSKRNGLLLAMVILCVVAAPVYANTHASSNQQVSIQNQIDKLNKAYADAVNLELQNGETKTVKSPKGDENLLTGKSAEKIKKLWDDTRKQIDELTARPTKNREDTANIIQTIVNEPVAYQYHDRMPAYDQNANVELYKSNKNIYTMDIATNELIEIDPINSSESGTQNSDKIQSQDALRKLAENLIKSVSKTLDVSKLVFSLGQKGANYFFRWEDTSKKLSSGMQPFVQVGYTQNGDLLNYVNTIPFSQISASTNSITPLIGPFNEIYANGGIHWLGQGPMTVWNNAGYCWLYPESWCTPRNVFWTYETSGSPISEGVWFPNSNNNTVAKAFIPYNNATGQALYHVHSPGLEIDYWINQNSYYDAWVMITQEGIMPSISFIDLQNVGNYSSLKIAWDEVWVYNP